MEDTTPKKGFILDETEWFEKMTFKPNEALADETDQIFTKKKEHAKKAKKNKKNKKKR